MSNYPPGYTEPESLDHYLERLEDGEPCHHPGCLNHITHPCEGCGRIAGRAPTNEDELMEDQKEIRLFDGQWTNIVNHDNCFAGYTVEDAVNKAVKLTEEAMARNVRNERWPPSRKST